MKHVRSEKDVYCLMRMVDTNVLFLDDFLRELPQPAVNVFSVSSDKAVNPANLMGATKMVMEKVLLLRSQRQPFATARFANVAFSNGSLPFGFIMRMQKKQPLAGPGDVKRYFISHDEAGQLCVLSCVLGKNANVFFPKLANLPERTFSEIAANTLKAFGYEPYECSSEDEARSRIDELLPKKKWPCYFTPSDTTGEKPFEEFYGRDDTLDLDRFKAVGIIQQSADAVDRTAVEEFLRFARAAKLNRWIKKEHYVAEFQKVIPTLGHVEKDNVLDGKM
jgi:FlaA1/EpsC-like NDP-sugar epimerase